MKTAVLALALLLAFGAVVAAPIAEAHILIHVTNTPCLSADPAALGVHAHVPDDAVSCA